MKLCRFYGKPPYVVCLLHGGPGARGEMAPVAKKLSPRYGVIDFFQNRRSLNELCNELDILLAHISSGPFTIAGYSFGAWLGWLFAAKYPERVKSLTLISSGPFLTEYEPVLRTKRNSRLGKDGTAKAAKLETLIQNHPSAENIAAYGALMEQADSFQRLPETHTEIDLDTQAFQTLWPEAEGLRKSGALLEAGKGIRCPVTAIHGEDDPHPAEGVEIPLKPILKDFQMIRLSRCGHTPWKETFAHADFHNALLSSLGK